ncbi:MAG: helix-turn-helix transcriptional regulator [Gemmatimonadetes bacterium]|nr:helix-turn-helix transcriptional regulator [Gemmatimonadota bacterium]
MSRGYGQYCPLSLAAEVLCERWTLLVVSRLLMNCSRFNEIHKGLPRMSASLLSQRLLQLEESGVLRREKITDGRGYSYHLTEAGRDLASLVNGFAVWGHEWARDLTQSDLDPRFLVWSMHLRLDTRKMPAGRTVLEFDFSGAPADCRRFWLVNDNGEVEMCLTHPGFDVDLSVRSDLKVFVECWRGFRDLRNEIRARRIKLRGPRDLKRQFPDWLLLHVLAGHERKRGGPERTLARRSAKYSSSD